jgi:hypothetical protein
VVAIEIESDGGGHDCEFVGFSFAKLEVRRVASGGGKLDRDDQFAVTKDIFNVGRIAGGRVKILDIDAAGRRPCAR